jgi:hypothetical protein
MIRKFALALGTTAILAAAALTPTAASAHWHHHGYGWGHGYGYGYGYGPVVVVDSPACYYTKQKVYYGGHRHWKTIQVCN